MSSNVITRFPPSPTGFFHIGSARTALFNYLFAAHNKGVMIFRFEDTDKARNKKEYEDDIIASLKWLGIEYTLPKVYRQSERTGTYKAALEGLVAADTAYISTEPSKDDPTKQVSLVRLRNPGTSVTFTDSVRGEVTFDTTELGDFVIARGVDDPLYHLTVVVDDHEMGITHVIRGEDHISNTPRQILIQEALSFIRPEYAHIPLILAPDRSKLSKRHGAISVNEYRAQGFLPDALVNYLALLGWNPGGEKELFSLDELIEEFDIEKIQKGGAIFDIKKLRWFNREYLLRLPEDVFEREAGAVLKEALSARTLPWDETMAKRLMHMLRERIEVWSDIKVLVEAGDLDFFFKDPTVDASKVAGKGSDMATALKHLEKIQELLSPIGEKDFANAETVKTALWDYATSEGRAAVLWPLRYALTGKERSPDPFIVAATIGKEATLQRVINVMSALQASS